jgi:hypothetical protein
VKSGPACPFSVGLAQLTAFCITAISLTGCLAQLDDLREAGGRGVASSEVEGVDAHESVPWGSIPGVSSMDPTGSAHSAAPGSSSRDEVSSSGSCSNGVWDEDETNVDCGGAHCPACGDAGTCEGDDCDPQPCEGNCLALTCANGFMDSNETDQDCGGTCLPCAAGAGCYAGEDCESGVCLDAECQAPSCDDKVHNGAEADVDCGAECDPCANGEHCLEAADCASGVCAERLCVEARCTDGQHNGAETDVDCGGPDCQPCADGSDCYEADDCESSVCDRTSHMCIVPTCSDATLNGTETGTDCGGDCEPCDEGVSCHLDTDCRSGVCADGACRASCTDGEHNQSESDVDCGGECAGCAVGANCETADDCRSGACDEECLPGVAGRPCVADVECSSGSCTNEVCDGAPAGAACSSNSDCITEYCAGTVCGRGALNAPCATDADCAADSCEDQRCAASGFRIETDGGEDTSVVDFDVRLQSSDADPPRQWKDLALLYFFSAEAHDNFVSRYYAGPDFDVWDDRFLARSFDGRDWAMIWRAAPNNTVVAPSTVTNIVYQVRNDPWTAFTLTNDYSFRSGYGPNAKVVVCQRVDKRWVHTQGIAPTTFPDPCALVVDTCNGAAGLCDPLMRTQ